MPVEPAGDFDYEALGSDYSAVRRTDPRIASLRASLRSGPRCTVVNVGAGAGSYEPPDRLVTPVEPSAFMRSQRVPGRPAALEAVAEDLPFLDASFDAAMAMVTVHQWGDHDRGLRELRRVSRGPVVILTFDGEALDKFWLASLCAGAHHGRAASVSADRSHPRCPRRHIHGDGGTDSDRLHGWLHRSVLCSPRTVPRPGGPPGAVRLGIRFPRGRAEGCRPIAERP